MDFEDTYHQKRFKMKYVMFEVDSDPKIRVPVIFPNFMVHSIVAEAAVKILEQHEMPAKVVSAGDLTLGILGVHCSGGSKILGVEAHSLDGWIITHYDYFHGLMPDEPVLTLGHPFQKRFVFMDGHSVELPDQCGFVTHEPMNSVLEDVTHCNRPESEHG